MIDQTHVLDVVPGGVAPVVHVKQYQTDEKIFFKLWARVGELTVPTSYVSCVVRGTKADGNGYSAPAGLSDGIVTVQLTEQMTAVYGKQPFEIVITDSHGRMITATFFLDVQRAALDGSTITRDSVLEEINLFLENHPEYIEEALAQIAVIDDETVRETVEDWLDDHPEATTTVQPGSIDETKLHSDVIKAYHHEYVTPQQYGAKADGTTDDRDKIQQAIDSGKPVLMIGNFKIASALNIHNKDGFVFDAKASTITYTGTDYALNYRSVRNSEFHFGTIVADNGGCIYFDGSENSYWSQYNNFFFNTFKAGPNHACVKVEQTASGCWISEQRWHNGRIQRGKYGFHFVRTSANANMSHWNFHEVGFEEDNSNVLNVGVKFESNVDGKTIGSFLFSGCRHERGEFKQDHKFIQSTGTVTKMNFINEATFPFDKLDIDSNATDWRMYSAIEGDAHVINGQIIQEKGHYALEWGTEITANTDLNSIRSIGNYYCSGHDTAATLSNCPTDLEFIMKVENRAGVEVAQYRYYRQTLTTINDEVFVRRLSSSNSGSTWTFSDWKRTTTAGEPYVLEAGEEITANTDLNTIRTIGNYYCKSHDTAATLSNCPTTREFIMKVENRAGVVVAQYRYFRQTITTERDEVYVRRLSSSDSGSNWTYSDWKLMNPDQQTPEISAWQDVSSAITYDTNYVSSGNGHLKMYYNPDLGMVHISGNATMTIPVGTTTIATISSDYKPKEYYTALSINHGIANEFDCVLYCKIYNRKDLLVKSSEAITSGSIDITGTYLLY